MKKVEVMPDQTILDLALQYYGTADGVDEIIRLNPDIKNDPARLAVENRDTGSFYPDLRLAPGQEIIIDDSGSLIRKSIVRKITGSITTYITEEWQEQLMR